jgi:hypothetical protein
MSNDKEIKALMEQIKSLEKKLDSRLAAGLDTLVFKCVKNNGSTICWVSDPRKKFTDVTYVRIIPTNIEVTLTFTGGRSPFVSLPGDPSVDHDRVIAVGKPTTFLVEGVGDIIYPYTFSCSGCKGMSWGSGPIHAKRGEPEIIVDNDPMMFPQKKKR